MHNLTLALIAPLRRTISSSARPNALLPRVMCQSCSWIATRITQNHLTLVCDVPHPPIVFCFFISQESSYFVGIQNYLVRWCLASEGGIWQNFGRVVTFSFRATCFYGCVEDQSVDLVNFPNPIATMREVNGPAWRDHGEERSSQEWCPSPHSWDPRPMFSQSGE